ncbi:hypothetical protein ACPOM7_11050 [Peribacillus castrilensis]|uniref:hypothetical protein n=1 Tax=Peribacillus frigoritolerans TaxID=450367 RepID=UPI00115D140C|nr:hypothetical protein [Peribacillus frigoritolerans]MCP1152756.1 hypothetical protein [Peribacillus frigoritolerans]MCT1388409.1 hypothetical protein [Peribacillus frigoritolerans]NCT38688.1 hypothetical protein [Peribacillus frigoritolerans]
MGLFILAYWMRFENISDLLTFFAKGDFLGRCRKYQPIHHLGLALYGRNALPPSNQFNLKISFCVLVLSGAYFFIKV